MSPHGVGPQPWQECRFELATIGVCLVQEANHDYINNAHFWLVYAVQIKRPMIVVGTSLGGAIAMDFALEYPQAVKKLVLVDAQGFIDGLGPWRVAPKLLINLLVQVSHQHVDLQHKFLLAELAHLLKRQYGVDDF
jgi:pimeloyl-ACP methyl ester carboxylesterase